MKSELKDKVAQSTYMEGKGTKQEVQKTAEGEGKKRLLTAYEIYNNLANGKIGDFIKVKDYISGILEQLLQEGKIGTGVVLTSRIKSPESVVQNWKLGKDLNDIFGITLLTTNDHETAEIRARLREEKRFNISSKKEMNKKRGYEAFHFLFDVGDAKKNKTKVECHMQTHEAYKNVYPHVLYKARIRAKRNLTPEEERQIKAAIQEQYDTGKIAGYRLSNGRSCRIPQMWVTSFNQQGKMEEQELDEKMILTIMYPFLDISKKELTVQSIGETKLQSNISKVGQEDVEK